MRVLMLSVLAIPFTGGCDLVVEDIPSADTDPVKADILFVVDNSASMSDETSDLLREIDNFTWEGIDYRLAITTTTNTTIDGWTMEPDPGEAGLFVGTEPAVHKDDPDASHRFKENLGCWASCWTGYDMQSDPTYLGTPGDCPFPDTNDDGEVDDDDVATTQYLDCLCVDVSYPAGENWDANELCGSGLEMHLESTLMSLCRSVDEPPDTCTHSGSSFEDSWIQTNNDWLREDSTIFVVYISDEGDTSEISLNGLLSNGEDEVDAYLDAFNQFDRTIKFAAIGPDLQCDSDNNCSFECNTGGATTQGVRRLMNIAQETGGFYNSITQGDDCEISGFSKHLNDLSELIKGLD